MLNSAGGAAFIHESNIFMQFELFLSDKRILDWLETLSVRRN